MNTCTQTNTHTPLSVLTFWSCGIEGKIPASWCIKVCFDSGCKMMMFNARASHLVKICMHNNMLVIMNHIYWEMKQVKVSSYR